jgi:glycosyltransferase involved in cell wall biosynthesis
VVRLARRLRRLRPDLVHANSLKSALYGGLAGRIAGVPVVWHVRDRIAGDYLPPAAVRLVRAAARWLPAGAVANSATTLATLGNVRRSVVVPSPVAGGAPATAANGGPLRVGVLGRLAPWKGQHVFLQAFAHAFPHGDEQAVVVGAALFGEEAYVRELRDLAGRVGLDGRVEFRGFREDVAAELARLDVLVHCSVVPEPFGQVVLEGMAAGIPVVAAAAGGPAEVVDDGVNGLLYPPGDAAALAALLRRLAADPGLRRRLGAAGPQAAEAFSPEAVAARMGAFYTELTGNRSE